MSLYVDTNKEKRQTTTEAFRTGVEGHYLRLRTLSRYGGAAKKGKFDLLAKEIQKALGQAPDGLPK